MRGHLEFLADDALEGRAPATRGGELAALYISAQFRRLGLEPAGDSGSYFHRVPIISLTPTPILSVSSASGARTLAYSADYVLWSMHDEPSVRVAADLVYVGYGIVAPEYQWNDYAGLDVRGKIVVALVNEPGIDDSTIFRGKVFSYYGRWTYKLEEAERQGAAGILLVHTDESATYPWTTVTSSWTGPQVRATRSSGPLVVAGWLARDAAAGLFGGAAELDRAMSAAGRRGFKSHPLGARAEATVRSTVRRGSTSNVVARYAGRGPLAHESVIIGGHYDHLGVGAPVNGDSIYNGALDNASGTGAVLAIAEAFVTSGVRPGRAIVFIAFGAEERGLLGSTAFAERPSIPVRDIAALINVDGVNLHGRTRDVAALGLEHSSLGRVFTAAAAAEGLRVSTSEEPLMRGYFFRSDQFPLARIGVPAIALRSGSDFVGRPASLAKQLEEDYNARRYHQPDDEVLETFRYDGAGQAMRVVVRTAMSIAAAPAQPTWNDTSEFREAGERRVSRR